MSKDHYFSSRQCKACGVGWAHHPNDIDGARCWVCGNVGDHGAIPLGIYANEGFGGVHTHHRDEALLDHLVIDWGAA